MPWCISIKHNNFNFMLHITAQTENINTTQTILWPLYTTTCINLALLKILKILLEQVLLSTCPGWEQVSHLDEGDARVFLHSVTNSVALYQFYIFSSVQTDILTVQFIKRWRTVWVAITNLRFRNTTCHISFSSTWELILGANQST